MSGIPTSNSGQNPGVPYGPAVWYTQKHLFVYGHELQLPEARLQNWYPASFTDASDNSIRFPTMEHYIMYRKAILFSDQEIADKVLIAATPTEANALGREIKGFESKKWREVVPEVAETGAWLKFLQVKECREALLATGDKILAESSPADKNWGIGFRGDEAEENEKDWGRNLCGESMMKVRDRLRSGEGEKA